MGHVGVLNMILETVEVFISLSALDDTALVWLVNWFITVDAIVVVAVTVLIVIFKTVGVLVSLVATGNLALVWLVDDEGRCRA